MGCHEMELQDDISLSASMSGCRAKTHAVLRPEQQIILVKAKQSAKVGLFTAVLNLINHPKPNFSVGQLICQPLIQLRFSYISVLMSFNVSVCSLP